MTDRVCITIDDDIKRMLRDRQADIMERTGRPVSFSRMVNDMLREGMK